MYDLSGPENADNQCDPTKIVDTESGDGSLFAAVRSLNAFLTVSSYTPHFHVTQPCSPSRERATPRLMCSFPVCWVDCHATQIQCRVNRSNSEADTEVW